MNTNWTGYKMVSMNLDLHHMLRQGLQQWTYQVSIPGSIWNFPRRNLDTPPNFTKQLSLINKKQHIKNKQSSENGGQNAAWTKDPRYPSVWNLAVQWVPPLAKAPALNPKTGSVCWLAVFRRILWLRVLEVCTRQLGVFPLQIGLKILYLKWLRYTLQGINILLW